MKNCSRLLGPWSWRGRFEDILRAGNRHDKGPGAADVDPSEVPATNTPRALGCPHDFPGTQFDRQVSDQPECLPPPSASFWAKGDSMLHSLVASLRSHRLGLNAEDDVPSIRRLHASYKATMLSGQAMHRQSKSARKKKSPTFKDVETGTARRYALFRLQPHLLVAAHLGTVLVFGALTS